MTSREGEDTREEQTLTEDQTLPWSVTDDQTLPWSITDDRTLPMSATGDRTMSLEKLDMSDDAETREGDRDDGCSTVTSVTLGTEAGDSHRGDGEDGEEMGTLSGESEDVLLSAVIKNEMVRDSPRSHAEDTPENIPENIPEDIPRRHVPKDISQETDDNRSHKDNQDSNRYMDCKKGSVVSDSDSDRVKVSLSPDCDSHRDSRRDGVSVSPDCDSHQETGRGDRDGTEDTLWAKVERPKSGERVISELVISLKSPTLTPVCKVLSLHYLLFELYYNYLIPIYSILLSLYIISLIYLLPISAISWALPCFLPIVWLMLFHPVMTVLLRSLFKTHLNFILLHAIIICF